MDMQFISKMSKIPICLHGSSKGKGKEKKWRRKKIKTLSGGCL